MDPSNINTELAKELLDAHTHIWNTVFSFQISMALKCAIGLGIPDAIHNHGKSISLTELANLVTIHPLKTPALGRLMLLLSNSNFFSKKLVDGEPIFDLTLNSRLLLKEHPLTLAPLVLVELDPIIMSPAHHWTSWFRSEGVSAFQHLHGQSVWEHNGIVEKFNECFNEGMASDARLIASVLMANAEAKHLFEGVKSLVDVGGGNGTMAKALVKAYPGLKCVVLDLPQVVEGLQNEENLAYVGGDMFKAIPPADVVLLKWILHNWSDEHCVTLLERCKEAIPSKDQGGKVVIIDMVVDDQTDNMNQFNAQILSDVLMMSVTVGGKERTEEEWKKLFVQTGFNDFKILPILGSRSIIEIYPK